jgi:hypothetical protein
VLVMFVIDGDGNLVTHATVTNRHYQDPAQSPTQIYYATSYSTDLLVGGENTVLGELSAGAYRIVVEINGQMLERWVEVESGQLTQVAFVVK